jgi:putative peptidoglycan lipid II flippase
MTAPRSIARTSLRLLPSQIVLRTAEALLPLVVSAWFGCGAFTDVYYLAWAIFSLAGSLVFSAFQDSAVVPILAEVKQRAPDTLADVRGSLLAHTALAATVTATAIGGAARVFFTLRYTGAQRATALALVLPFSLFLVTLALRTFFASMLHAERRYGLPPVARAAGAALALATVGALRGSLSVAAIPWGFLVGEAATTALLVLATRAAGIAFHPTLARPAPVRRIVRLVASEVGGGAVTRVNPLVDQLAASLAGIAGAGTALQWSSDVASVPTSLLQSALLPVLLTHLSEDYVAGDLAAMRASVRRALAVVIAVLAAASVVLGVTGDALLPLLFAHGSMDAAGVARIAHILPYHLVGVAPFGALLVLSRAHVAAQNSRLMLAIGVLNAVLNAALDLLFLPFLGVEGVALATSCTHAVVAFVFFIRFEARLDAVAADATAAAGAGAAAAGERPPEFVP